MSLTPADGPHAYEDSVTRIATEEEANVRRIVGRFDKRTYTLIDGPNAGQTVEFWVAIQEVDATISGPVDVFVTNDDFSPVVVSGSVQVDGSVEIKNTPVPVTQSGSWTVSVSGEVEIKNDSGNPVPVSGTVAVSNFPATQPVSAASLPLPSGASTAAKQPAIGTAGTASADVITVQGVASMTPVQVDHTKIAGTAVDVNSGNKSAGTQRVVLATDQPVVKTTLNSGTATRSSLSANSTAQTVLASNSGRLGATIYNEGSGIVYLALGGSATTTDYTVQLTAGAYYEVPFGFTGLICAVCASAITATLRITELT